jgi:hypothetical protein
MLPQSLYSILVVNSPEEALASEESGIIHTIVRYVVFLGDTHMARLCTCMHTRDYPPSEGTSTLMIIIICRLDQEEAQDWCNHDGSLVLQLGKSGIDGGSYISVQLMMIILRIV